MSIETTRHTNNLFSRSVTTLICIEENTLCLGLRKSLKNTVLLSTKNKLQYYQSYFVNKFHLCRIIDLFRGLAKSKCYRYFQRE